MATSPRVMEIKELLTPHRLAAYIGERYGEWKHARRKWEEEKIELRNYLFATDTTTTTNAKLPWKNKTTLPKLTQIRDNLHANYMATLFPNDRWMVWEGADEPGASADTRTTIENYMLNKLDQSQFEITVSELLLDFIDEGNCIAGAKYVRETTIDALGNEVVVYEGPKAIRYSPFDVVFDLTAPDFNSTPTITRSMVSLGDLQKMVETREDLDYDPAAFKKVLQDRMEVSNYRDSDIDRAFGYAVDGFGSMSLYYRSGMVELLEFEGDIYDEESGELLSSRIITVADRATILRNIQTPSWFGRSNKQHCGWRKRPGNLMAMGPLDNLVGMQYRIDHLENMKADAFDLMVNPPLKIKGYVEDFDWRPYEKIFIGDEGDVLPMPPSEEALRADFEISQLERRMEEFAGAPKQAMGFRTPGEKTAYEVSVLESGASRIFQQKIKYFEENLLEPLLNVMLEVARRNISSGDLIRVMDDDYGAVRFLEVTKEDITARGRLRPVGARHFASQAQLVQNLTQLMGSAVGQDPAVKVHFSGWKTAQLINNALNLERYDLVEKDARVYEQAETQATVDAAAKQLGQQQAPQQDQQVAAQQEELNGQPTS